MSFIKRLERAVKYVISGSSGPTVARTSRIDGSYTGMHAYLEPRVKDLGLDKHSLSLAANASVWAWRCINLRARTIARMPWYVTRIGDDEPATGTPWHRAQDFAYAAFEQNLMWLHEMSLSVYGEAYFEKLHLGRTRIPGGLRYLNALAMHPQVVRGEITHYQYQGSGVSVPLYPDEIARHTYPNLRDDLAGWSPLMQALRPININRKAAVYIAAYYDNDATPGGLLTLGPGQDPLDEEEIELVLKQWRAQFKGAHNAFKVGIVPAAFEFRPFDSDPPDQQVELSEEQRREICAALEVPMSMVDAAGVSDPLSAGSTMDKQTANFYESWAVPEVEDILRFDNTHVMPWLAPGYELKCDTEQILSLVRSSKERSDMINTHLNAGGITVNEWRAKQGYAPEPQLEGLIYVPSVGPVPLKEMGNVWRYRLLIAPSVNNAEILTDVVEEAAEPTPAQTPFSFVPPPRLPAVTNPTANLPLASGRSANEIANKASTGSPGGAVVLKFDRAPLLMLQQVARAALNAEEGRVRWAREWDLHLTLVQSDLVDEQEYESIFWQTVAGNWQSVPVRITSFDTFEKDAYTVLMLKVERDPALVALQTRLHDTFVERGLHISEYSAPGDWQPHITLAYIDAAIPLPEMSLPDDTLEMTGDRIEFSRSSHYSEHVRDSADAVSPVKSVPTMDIASEVRTMVEDSKKAMHDELDAWERFITRRIGKTNTRQFVTKAIPAALAGDIQNELDLAGDDRDTIKAVFEAGRAMLEDTGLSFQNHFEGAKFSKITPEVLAEVMERWQEIGLTPLLDQAEAMDAYLQERESDGESDGDDDNSS